MHNLSCPAAADEASICSSLGCAQAHGPCELQRLMHGSSCAALSWLCAVALRVRQMWQWKRSEGKEFVFFQSHAAMSFGSQNVTNEFYQKIICHMMANSLHLVVERTQRWKCPTYRDGGEPNACMHGYFNICIVLDILYYMYQNICIIYHVIRDAWLLQLMRPSLCGQT